jgi:hypothetical protein
LQHLTSVLFRSWGEILSRSLGLVFCFALAFQAHAGPVTVFSLPFTFTNVNADGSALVTNAGLTLQLTGGNNGSGLEGTTDLTTSAPAPGTVSFHFAYSSLDIPGFDFAGYLLGGAFTQFADTDGQVGDIAFAVSLGQIYGFRIDTPDNQGEPGIVTISNFSGPGSSVPEPGTLLFAVAGTLLMAGKMRHSRRDHSDPAN